jgi:heme exporter protein C
MIFKIFSGVLISLVIILVFVSPPPQAQLGEISRIFYFHVPAAWVCVLAFFVSLINSIGYLKNRAYIYDLRAVSAARLGFLFSVLALISGSVFARYTWGSFWNWDPRETSILVLLLIYGAYFALRSAVDIEERKATLSAVYSILSFATVPFLVFLVPWVFPSLHPKDSIINSQFKFQIPFPRLILFLFSLLGFSLIFIWMHRMEISIFKLIRRKEEGYFGQV